mmetsp:Transcript_10903/g.10413  ORF Transcript_10903/g.10413 Transcript_10903/m.10413 type:complete len:155 (-) Transcript_10903:627-1091(-)
MASAIASSSLRKTSLVAHHTIQSYRLLRKSIGPEVKIGFVPTMGALHEGHLSLVKHARDNNDLVVASIFVNPTQFGDGEDLDNYPRQLQRDTELLTDMGVDHLFVPNKEIMYGSNHVTYVHPKVRYQTRQLFEDFIHANAIRHLINKLLILGIR